MPVINVHVMAGYPPEVLSRLADILSDAVQQVVPAPSEAITVMVNEVSPAGYRRGGVARSPAPALPDPRAVVEGFLEAMAARDLTTAQSFLGDEFRMVFPGGVEMTRLEDLIDWSKPRYATIAKRFAGWDLSQDGARTIVYCRGTLSGTWTDGSAFADISFVDRFELEGGLIVRQNVWNDMAEAKRGSDAPKASQAQA
ncbi:MAG: tautomerase family protein [Pseudomonadota bacterium]